MSDHAFVSIPVTRSLSLQIDDIVGSLSVPGWFVDNIVMLSAAGFELKLETTILRKDGRFKLRAISIVGVPCEPARVWGWEPVSTKVVDQAGGDHVTVDGKPPEAGDAVYWKAPELGRPKRVRLTCDIRFVGKAGSEHDVIDSYCGLVTVTRSEGDIRSLPVLDEDNGNYEVIERWPVSPVT